MVKGVLYVSMKEANTCPQCDAETSVVKLGSEPPREVCGRFGCSFDGETLTRSEAEKKVSA